MKKFVLLLLLFIPSLTFAQITGKVSRSTKLILTHVTVIDGSDAPPRRDMTVVIVGNRISKIDATNKIANSQKFQIIDATGNFLIPGLWDMHVHPDDKQDLSLFIANGVTGIRIMWGSAAKFGWRRDREDGKLLAPYMEIASPLIDGPKPFWPGSVSVRSETEARTAVDTAKVSGADFVKVYTFLPREEFFGIADEAKKQGIPFAGHVPMSVSAQEA
jgi:hypothetical protein